MDVDNTPLRRRRGVTLVELVAVVAVVGISLATLAPAWSALVQRNRVATAGNTLLSHLRFARNQAVTRGRFVTLCPSDDGEHCSGDHQGWHRGYLVFEDNDDNRHRGDGEPVLRVQDRAGAGILLHSTAGRPAVRFRADGAAWSSNTTFTVCAPRPGHEDVVRAVILYGSGRARIDRRAADGDALACR